MIKFFKKHKWKILSITVSIIILIVVIIFVRKYIIELLGLLGLLIFSAGKLEDKLTKEYEKEKEAIRNEKDNISKHSLNERVKWYNGRRKNKF
jgi:c-di-AMP phosphodiesterase-like protein